MACLTKHERDQIALKFISRYNILIDGKHTKNGLIGWRTALATARKYYNPIFEPNKVIEILNVWTGEIITLAEAEKRAAKTRKKADISAVQ